MATKQKLNEMEFELKKKFRFRHTIEANTIEKKTVAQCFRISNQTNCGHRYQYI